MNRPDGYNYGWNNGNQGSFYTPQGYYFPPQQSLSPEQQEQKKLRSEGNYIGSMMLALTAGTQLSFTVLSLILVLTGVLNLSQLSLSDFGLGNTVFLLLYALSYTLAMLVPAVLVALCGGRRHFPLSPAKSVYAPDAFFGILAAMGICMVANIVASYFIAFLQQFGVPMPEMPDFLEPNLQSLLLNIGVFAVLPALLEELVFRGYVLRALRPYGDWFAVIISAVLFGLMHGNLLQIPFALIVGIALGWLYIMTDNIWISVAVHFCNNAFSFLLQYVTMRMPEQQQNMLSTIVIFAIAGLGILAMAVLLIMKSSLFRPLSRQTALTVGQRVSGLMRSPVFVLSVIVFIGLTIVGVLL